MKSRTVLAPAVAGLAAALVVPAGAAQAAPAARPASQTADLGYKTLAVPGLRMKCGVPQRWGAVSPKSLYNAHVRKYPASIRYLAKASHETPSRFLSSARNVNLVSYGRPFSHFIPSIEFIDVGARNVSTAQLAAQLHARGIRTTAVDGTMSAGFHEVQRIGYTARATRGVTYYGVMGIMRVGGHTVLSDASSARRSNANAISIQTLSRCSPR